MNSHSKFIPVPCFPPWYGRVRLILAMAACLQLGAAWGFNFRNEPGKVCLDCHVEKKSLLEKRFAHGPFVLGNCEECHDAERISLRAEGADLCLECHESFRNKMTAWTEQHEPVRWSDCTACHEPHATSYRYSLRAPGAALCESCHLDKKDQKEWPSRHEPFAAGRCDDCHDPHGSTESYLLAMPVKELCAEACHDYQTEQLAEKHHGFDVTRLSCSSCHDPHASRRPSMVREDIHPPVARGLCEHCHTSENGEVRLVLPEETFCEGCHAGTLNEEERKGNQHGPFRKRQCVQCHAAHGSQEPAMLLAREHEVCLKCHQDLREKMKGRHAHRPFVEAPCTACHDAHASEFSAALNVSESETCFECHRENVFRRVLFSHAPVAKGNCIFCHDGHGTENRFLLKRQPAETCMRCHPDPTHIGDHPVLMETSDAATGDATGEAVGGIRFPSSLNLYRDKDGTYSCIVCHQAHGGNRAFYLRRPLDRGELCFECHSRRGNL